MSDIDAPLAPPNPRLPFYVMEQARPLQAHVAEPLGRVCWCQTATHEATCPHAQGGST